jgi:hypothetical protein
LRATPPPVAIKGRIIGKAHLLNPPSSRTQRSGDAGPIGRTLGHWRLQFVRLWTAPSSNRSRLCASLGREDEAPVGNHRVVVGGVEAGDHFWTVLIRARCPQHSFIANSCGEIVRSALDAYTKTEIASIHGNDLQKSIITYVHQLPPKAKSPDEIKFAGELF